MDSLSIEETRNKTVSAAVTESEQWAVQLVARTEKRPVSDLMREFSLSDLIARGESLNAKLLEGATA